MSENYRMSPKEMYELALYYVDRCTFALSVDPLGEFVGDLEYALQKITSWVLRFEQTDQTTLAAWLTFLQEVVTPSDVYTSWVIPQIDWQRVGEVLTECSELEDRAALLAVLAEKEGAA